MSNQFDFIAKFLIFNITPSKTIEIWYMANYLVCV